MLIWLQHIPLLIYLLAFISALPIANASPSERPFPDISFKDFNKFFTNNFSPHVSLATVLLVLFTMTENSDLPNLHACQNNPQCVGELRQSSSGWIRALARSLNDRLLEKATNLFKEAELPQENPKEYDLVTPLSIKLGKLMNVLELNPFSKSGKQATNPCLRHSSALLRLPTAWIRGLLGVTPPDPWLHHNSGNSLHSQ